MRALKSCVSDGLRDQSGSVAILFGLSLCVLFGFSALAVDFARGQSTKDAVQQDLDATILYVGKQAALAAGQGQTIDAQTTAQDYMDALQRQKQSTAAVKVSVLQTDAETFQGTADTSVTATMMGLFGYSKFAVKVSSEAKIGQKPVEFALVLDNTGSMDGNKMAALKTSANSLVDTLFLAPNADQHVKVSVVPFAQYVNVGLGNRNQSWIKVSPDSTKTQNVCSTAPAQTTVPGSCHDVTYNYTVDGIPKTGTTQQCQYTAGPNTTQCGDVTTTETWSGCAGSRAYPLNTLDQDYSKKVPGVLNASCPTEVTPLTNQKSTVTAALNAMTAVGETYIPAGLMWGWATLSSQAPYDQSEDVKKGQKTRKIMVLMTDGFNTLSPTVPYDGTHWGTDTTQSNTYTTELCTNIKNSQIEIYSVAFEVTDQAVKSILQNCASSANNFFDASDPQSLQDSFDKIAADFSPLRLSR